MPTPDIISGKDTFLAVAFTDADEDGKFHFKKDALIAAVVDTDKSSDVSVGDTVVFDTYPHLDGSQAGKFLGDDATVTDFQIIEGPNAVVTVEVEGGQVEFWAFKDAATAPSGITFEFFRTTVPGKLESQFYDEIGGGTGADLATAFSNVHGPGHPDTDLDEALYQPGDSGFLGVLIA